jgi:hypothetical protein
MEKERENRGTSKRRRENREVWNKKRTRHTYRQTDGKTIWWKR